jgi:hypothetical protein
MMTFEDERVMLTVTPELAIEAMTLKRRFDGAFSLVGLAEMRLIFEGVVASLPFLPV